MKMKTLLLGSAAAFAFAAGSAQAADLSVAEPVDYVRVCDAFGTGYYYIPGTDTCLRIGGFVRFELRFRDDEYIVGGEHSENYNFFTRASFQIEARSQTDWGPLIGFMEFETDMVMTNGTYNSSPEVQEAFLSIGPLTAGLKQSAYDFGGGYTMSGLDDGYGDGTAITGNKLNQIQLAWAMNGFGIILAVEDQQARAQDWYVNGSSAGDMPDLVAAITGEWGNVSAKIAFLYADSQLEETWGVQGGFEVTNLFNGRDRFLMAAGYINDQAGGTITSVLASFRHYWMSNLFSGVTVRYDSYGGVYSDGDNWMVAFDTRYSPVEDFYIGVGLTYQDSNDSLRGVVRLQRDFNN